MGNCLIKIIPKPKKKDIIPNPYNPDTREEGDNEGVKETDVIIEDTNEHSEVASPANFHISNDSSIGVGQTLSVNSLDSVVINDINCANISLTVSQTLSDNNSEHSEVASPANFHISNDFSIGVGQTLSLNLLDSEVIDDTNCANISLPVSPTLSDNNSEQTEVLSLPASPSSKKTQVRGIYNFKPSRHGDLMFRKGDFLLVSSDLRDSWWHAEHKKTHEVGMIPCNYVVVDDGSPASLDGWFQICRIEAEKKLLLPGYDDGIYIMRPSNKSKKHFALSVRVFEPEKQFYVVKHYIIRVLPNGHYCITSRNQFADVKSLLSHYYRHIDGLCCRLKKPFPKLYRPPIQFRDLDVNRDCITLDKPIGNGNFGEVWLARWNDSIEVAVKMLKRNSMDPNLRKSFLDEAELMHKLYHPKIVAILGICCNPEESPLYIITEYMSKGSLLDFLHRDEGKNLVLRDMVSIFTQIAEGMSYLESQSFIHRDLRAANILVADDLTVKVADFGLARLIEGTYMNHSDGKFPVRWTSPEAGLRQIFSIKSDVWSFGVLIYEIVTYGKVPYEGLRLQDVLISTYRGVRLERPCGDNIICPKYLYTIMTSCWNNSPEKRPTFKHLKDVFENFPINSQKQYEITT